MSLGVDASLVEIHSEKKQGATSHYKGGLHVQGGPQEMATAGAAPWPRSRPWRSRLPLGHGRQVRNFREEGRERGMDRWLAEADRTVTPGRRLNLLTGVSYRRADPDTIPGVQR